MEYEQRVRCAIEGDVKAFVELTRRFQYFAFGSALALVSGPRTSRRRPLSIWSQDRLAALAAADTIIQLSHERFHALIYPAVDVARLAFTSD